MNLKSYCRGIGAGMIVTAIIMGIASNKRILTDDEVIKRARELGYTESSILTSVAVATVSDKTASSSSEAVAEPAKTDSSSDTKEDVKVSASSDSSVSIKELPEARGDDDTQLSETSISETKDNPEVTEPSEDPQDTDPKTDVPTDEPQEEPKNDPSEEPSDEPQSPASVEEPTNPSEVVIVPLGEAVTLTIERGDSSVKVARKLYELGIVASAVEFDQFLCSGGYDRYICTGQYVIAAGTDFETIAKMITKRL